MHPALARWFSGLVMVAALVAALLFLAALRLEWISLLPAGSTGPPPSEAVQGAPRDGIVRLAADKLAAADLHLAAATMQKIRRTRNVPGSIAYDATNHLPVTAPVSGVLVRVLVEPGQQVPEGEPLAVLSSPEIGRARDAVLQRQAELALAKKEQAWHEEIAANLRWLLAAVEQKPKPDVLEKEAAGKVLGAYRETILAPYSKLVLAELAVVSSQSPDSAAALSRRLLEERRSNREVAAAALSAACETSRFEAEQARDRARAAGEQAQRLLAVAEEELARLAGPAGDGASGLDSERLSELEIRSPLGGRIEERQAVQAARVAAGSPLFTVANTSALWIMAEIHERDWQALKIKAGSEIGVRIPAIDLEPLAARVRFVGAEVDPHSRSVPLVAEIDNDFGRLKPGMFVWVEVPLEPAREALVVPPSAIMRHESQPFVFVPAGPGAFRRIDVQLGLETTSAVEVAAGLAAGAEVVDRGAFYLKSELLLEREE